MPLLIVRNDITRMKVDAVVNAANSTLLGGGGVDGAIHRAAGPKLREECRTLGGCNTGEAKATSAYDLPAKYVIHTVGPVWYGGERGEESYLKCCYKNSLELALKLGCESVAFPLISAGSYRYPVDKAMTVAKDAVVEFLKNCDMTVYIVIFDRSSLTVGGQLFSDIQSYIDDRYVELNACIRRADDAVFAVPSAPISSALECNESTDRADKAADGDGETAPPKKVKKLGDIFRPRTARRESTDLVGVEKRKAPSLREALAQIDESFSEMLLRKIDEKGMTDAECYRKANIDRKLFSKIRSDRLYKPSKPTVLAFAIALELPIEETRDMLMKAGFALSHSNKFDIIIEYFIEHGNYNVFEINDALFSFDQSLLGM